MTGGSYRSPMWALARLAGLALAGYVLLAVAGSFAPFDIVPIPVDEAIARVVTSLGQMPARVPRIDFISNVILFAPLGFLLTAYLALRQHRVPGGVIDVWITLMGCMLLSSAIEAAQVYFPSRVVSPADILGETLGGLLGAVAWLLVGSTVWRAVDANHRSRRPALLMLVGLTGYGLLYAASQLLPFDITLEPSELAAKFHAGRVLIVPFSAPGATAGTIAAAAAVAALGAAPLGALLAGATSRQLRALGLAAGAAYVALVEMAQVLVASRVADTTDVLFGLVGLFAGAWLGSALHPGENDARRPRGDRRWPAAVATLVWLAGIALAEWAPFDFSADPQLVARHWAAFSATPFVNYFIGSEWQAFVNLVQKLLLVIPLGILVAVALQLDQARSAARSAGAILLTAAMLAIIEIGQIFLPTRTPDVTDVCLAALAGGAAVLVVACLPPQPSRCQTGTVRSRYGTV